MQSITLICAAKEPITCPRRSPPPSRPRPPRGPSFSRAATRGARSPSPAASRRMLSHVHSTATVLPSVVREIGGVEWSPGTPRCSWRRRSSRPRSRCGCCSSSGRVAATSRALAVFVLSIGCATAPDMAWMLAGRTVQGLGGGVLAALSYALIRLMFEARLAARRGAGVGHVGRRDPVRAGGRRRLRRTGALALGLLGPAAGERWGEALIAGLQLAGAQPGRDGRIQRRPADRPDPAADRFGPERGDRQPVRHAVRAGGHGALRVGAGPGAGADRPAREGPPAADRRLCPFTAFGAIYASVALLLIGTDTEIFVPYFLQTLHGHSPLAAGYLTAAMAGGRARPRCCPPAAACGPTALRFGPLVGMAGLIGLLLLVPVARWAPAAQTLGMALALGATGFGVGMGWPHLLTRVLTLAPRGEETWPRRRSPPCSSTAWRSVPRWPGWWRTQRG